MLVLAINKQTGEIHNDLQDTPTGAYVWGSRTRVAAKMTDTAPTEWLEYHVPDKNKAAVFAAKEVWWNKGQQQLTIILYSDAEKQQHAREQLIEGVETEMIDARTKLDAAEALGLDTLARAAHLNKLKAQHEGLKNG